MKNRVLIGITLLLSFALAFFTGAKGCWNKSNDNDDTTASGSSGALTGPNTPLLLAANAVNTSQINLSWTDASLDETGFKIERKTGPGGTYAQIAAVGPNVTSYSDTGLMPSTDYYYKIRSYNPYGYSNYSNEANATTYDAWLEVAAGGGHTLAISTNGTIWAWGNNSYSELGLGDANNRTSPTKIGSASNWSKTAAGDFHSLALTTLGTLWAWGRNDFGQLGTNDTLTKTQPTQIGTDNDWKIISAGDFHSLAVKDDKSIWSWGKNDWGQLGKGNTDDEDSPTKIGNDMDWDKVSAGESYTVAIKTDKTLWAWGKNDSGQLGLGDTLSRTEPTKVVTDTDWASAVAGKGYTIAVKTDGSLWAWGANDYGQLGLGDTISRTIPTRVGTDTNWATVSISSGYTMAIKTDGSLWAWGANDYGQLGLGDTISRTAPTKVGSETNWADVTTGDYHSVALKTNKTISSWGKNDSGQLGLDDTDDRDLPEPATGIPAAPTSLSNTVISLSQINLGWLDNSSNELGFKIWRKIGSSGNYTQIATLDANVTSYSNTGLSPLTTYYYLVKAYNGFGDSAASNTSSNTTNGSWLKVSAGYSHCVAIASNNSIWSWGDNDDGQLGLGTKGTGTNKSVPTRIGTLYNWDTILATSYHNMAVKIGGSLWSWGYNSDGQLGLIIWGSGAEKTSPEQITNPSSTDWFDIAAGELHSIIRKNNNSIWACGYNGYGQLGLGDYTRRTILAQMGSETNWLKIAAGRYHTLAIKTNGTLWAWGNNEYGQLGLGTSGSGTERTSPNQVGSANNWNMIAGGKYHTLAVKSDGTLWAWGLNNDGQLGLNDITNRNTPTRVGMDSDWAKVSAGEYHSIATKNDGTLWAWGFNNHGQLGLGDSGEGTEKLIPTKIGNSTGWSMISAGSRHNIALKNDGTIWTWGLNDAGQLGVNDYTDKTTPTKVGE
ncbi:MAG: chromosome condensation regulator RCC1 [Planctomycetes bacterium]|nr:chromosome condensation regulator RCC1 [Planctomycetota bacterium]